MKNKAHLVDTTFPDINCAQTVISLHAEELGMDKELALKLTSGFAGGMACAETCGAVTGSYMVIGVKHGHTTSDPNDKMATKERIVSFNRAFIAKHGSLKCKELTGFDISTEEGLDEAREKDVFNQKCPAFIKTACDVLANDF